MSIKFLALRCSNILELNKDGIDLVVKQQFDVAKQIIAAGLVPIIEPKST